MGKKDSMIGAGISGILSGGAKGAVKKENEEDFFVYRRGRPRKDEPRPNDGKVFRKTSMDLDVDLYKKIRDLSQEERIPIKDLMHRLLDYGYRAEIKRLSRDSA